MKRGRIWFQPNYVFCRYNIWPECGAHHRWSGLGNSCSGCGWEVLSHMYFALGLHPQQLQLQGFSELHTIYQFNNFADPFGLQLDQYKEHKNNKSLLWNAPQKLEKIRLDEIIAVQP